MEDPARHFFKMYEAHVAACPAAGITPPSPEEWVELVDDRVREGVTEDDDGEPDQ